MPEVAEFDVEVGLELQVPLAMLANSERPQSEVLRHHPLQASRFLPPSSQLAHSVHLQLVLLLLRLA